MKIKFFKTSLFGKNIKIDTTKDIALSVTKNVYLKQLGLYLSILTLLFLLSILVGCMMGPNYKRPQFFDNDEIEKVLDLKPTSEKAPLSILDFHDNTLNELLVLGLQNSPSIRTAFTKVRQARASVRISESDLMPSIDLNAKYNYLNAGQNMNLFANEDYYQSAIDMSWEIDIFGSNARRLEASKANLKGVIENLKNVHVSLTADIAIAYISLRTTEWLIQNAEENIRLQNDIYQTVTEQFNADLADEIALNQAKYLLETTKMTLPQFQQQKTEFQNTLALLVGQLPTTLNDILKIQKNNLVQQNFDYDLTRLYDLPADIIRNRPDVRVAEEQLIAGNAMIGAAIGDMFPKISLTGLLGFGSTKASNLFENASFESGISPQISLPLLHFGSLKNNVELKKAMKEEYLIAYEKALLTAAKEIHSAINNLQNEFKRNQSARIAYQKMQKVSKLNWQKYKQGLIPYADVLDSEQRKLSAQTNMVNSNAALYRNIISYYKAIGSQLITP
ncbi:MAG: TolC family protein [Alphaproteobacteria bacterium]|nr:TolC family protein [Alphaproteobacteria bacterium]